MYFAEAVSVVRTSSMVRNCGGGDGVAQAEEALEGVRVFGQRHDLRRFCSLFGGGRGLGGKGKHVSEDGGRLCCYVLVESKCDAVARMKNDVRIGIVKGGASRVVVGFHRTAREL